MLFFVLYLLFGSFLSINDSHIVNECLYITSLADKKVIFVASFLLAHVFLILLWPVVIAIRIHDKYHF